MAREVVETHGVAALNQHVDLFVQVHGLVGRRLGVRPLDKTISRLHITQALPTTSSKNNFSTFRKQLQKRKDTAIASSRNDGLADILDTRTAGYIGWVM